MARTSLGKVARTGTVLPCLMGLGVLRFLQPAQALTHRIASLAMPGQKNESVIWAMTRSHRQAILNLWPDASGRVHLLSADGQDVPDPIGGPIDQYQRCAEQIKAELSTRLKDLQV